MRRGVLAIDIGASGGRHILGSLRDDRLILEEIYRFPNGAIEKNGRLCWDEAALWRHITEGMKRCAQKGALPNSVGVDTWGVDYTLIDGRGERLTDCVAYRDGRTRGMAEKLEKAMPFAETYRLTGIAKQPFNTLYQLMTEAPETLAKAARFLALPDWFHYRLCGKAANEYTIASTSSLLNAETRDWDKSVLRAAGIPEKLFPEPPVMPGTRLGTLSPDVAAEVGFSCDVVLPAGHDTGSAFMAVPAKDEYAVCLSSGTWSLLGVKNAAPVTTPESRAAGFTNEGGYGGSIRFLKNIMGLWILQSVRREWRERYSFAEMADMAQRGRGYRAAVNVADNRFLAPRSMIAELRAALREQGETEPETDAELLACVIRSLAKCYADNIHTLEGLTGKKYTSINVVGGGSKNITLNRWTADETGLPVYAGPGEGTALGNIVAQLIARGEINDLSVGRELIRRSFPIELYEPRRSPESMEAPYKMRI